MSDEDRRANNLIAWTMAIVMALVLWALLTAKPARPAEPAGEELGAVGGRLARWVDWSGELPTPGTDAYVCVVVPTEPICS